MQEKEEILIIFFIIQYFLFFLFKKGRKWLSLFGNTTFSSKAGQLLQQKLILSGIKKITHYIINFIFIFVNEKM